MTRRYYSGRAFRARADASRNCDGSRCGACRVSRWNTSRAGAEDEVTLRRNREIFERITWLPRTLVGTGVPDLSTDDRSVTRCTCRWSSRRPASTACCGPQGDLALAKAAQAAGIAVHAQHRQQLRRRRR